MTARAYAGPHAPAAASAMRQAARIVGGLAGVPGTRVRRGQDHGLPLS